jgi:uncharacterized membrane protein
MFWGAEGAGTSWPGDDAALLAIVPVMLLASWGMARYLRSIREHATSAAAAAVREAAEQAVTA